MNRSIETLLARKPDAGQSYRFLLEDNAAVHSALHHPDDVQIWALSPSSVDVHQALSMLRYLLPSESNELTAVPNPRENHSASVVLHVRVGNQKILLGADREVPRIMVADGKAWRHALPARS